jgi:hypothetical protein
MATTKSWSVFLLGSASFAQQSVKIVTLKALTAKNRSNKEQEPIRSTPWITTSQLIVLVSGVQK